MGKRVNNGPDDDPDEIWIECGECEGSGTVSIPDDGQEPMEDADGNEVYEYVHDAECPDCGGLGYYAGDPDDVDE